jgi:hypothetical protein
VTSSNVDDLERRIGEMELLSEEEELRLARKARSGDPEARERLATIHQPLVEEITRTYLDWGVASGGAHQGRPSRTSCTPSRGSVPIGASASQPTPPSGSVRRLNARSWRRAQAMLGTMLDLDRCVSTPITTDLVGAHASRFKSAGRYPTASAWILLVRPDASW